MQGKDVVRQITAKGRFARALKSVHGWCKRNRHLPLKAQYDYLVRAIRGHCAYYGLTGNDKRLRWFRYQVARIWRKWLARRSRLRVEVNSVKKEGFEPGIFFAGPPVRINGREVPISDKTKGYRSLCCGSDTVMFKGK